MIPAGGPGAVEDFGPLGLGTAGFAFNPRASEGSCRAAVAAALAAGVRLFDTARAYTTVTEPSRAEVLLARALADADAGAGAGAGDGEVVVATKGGHHRAGPEEFPVDGRPATLRRQCEESLRFLGVERIGLYQLHRVDPAIPLEESVGALADLRAEGKVARVGLSNVTVVQLERARATTAIASVQNHLSYERAGDLPTARACRERGVAYLAHTPFGPPGSPVPPAGDPRAVVAARHGVSTQQVVLAWLARLAPGVVPLVGSTRPVTIRDSAAAGRLVLTAAELRLLGAGGTGGTWVRD